MKQSLQLGASILRVSIIGLLVGGALVAAADDSSEWASYRGPGVDGVVRDSAFGELGRLGLKVGWQVPIGSGYSGIAVAGGKVVTQYTDDGSDVIAAFDAAGGEKLWSYAFDQAYAGHDGSHDGPIATPLIADGRVIGLGPRGQFFAVDAETGKEIWKTHLADDHEIKKPHYGFGTSPILVDGVLVLELGGEGSAVAGFDPATGEKKWSIGSDEVGYQVPVPMSLDGRRQVVGAGEKKLFGFDAGSGELLWEWEHGGSGGPGAHSMTPIVVGEGRLFLAHKDQASKLVQLGGEGEAVFEDVWEDRTIRNSYTVPVYHDGHVYAYSARFLTCVDAATGESKWRSRAPGDGFLIAVDGRLVVVTKKGSVHLIEATPEGYREIAGLPVFADLSWSAPSFADGSIYVRSFGELARLDLTSGVLETGIEVAARGISDSAFDKFLAEVDAAEDKKAVVDRFMAAQKSFPIIEGDHLVHFVYRGPAEDVAVAGDLFGARQEQAMTRVPGTDVHYHSAQLEPDARANYLFIEDYDEVLDSRNPLETTSVLVTKDMEMNRSGEAMAMNWFAMPRWRSPAHLEAAPEASRGRLDSQELESEVLKAAAADRPEGAPPLDPKIALQVYVPRGYDDGEERYPVVYVHGGMNAVERGKLPNSLDNLIGDRVAPVIVVFFGLEVRGPQYDQAFTGDIVPWIDQTYRTLAAADGRANVGMFAGGIAALDSTLRHPEMFDKVALQSLLLLTQIEGMLYPLIEGLGEDRPEVYMDWGKYDMRNPHENWDIAAANRKMAQAFRDQGVEIAGGEVHDGIGWSSWRNRTDQVFEALFPMK